MKVVEGLSNSRARHFYVLIPQRPYSYFFKLRMLNFSNLPLTKREYNEMKYSFSSNKIDDAKITVLQAKSEFTWKMCYEKLYNECVFRRDIGKLHCVKLSISPRRLNM